MLKIILGIYVLIGTSSLSAIEIKNEHEGIVFIDIGSNPPPKSQWRGELQSSEAQKISLFGLFDDIKHDIGSSNKSVEITLFAQGFPVPSYNVVCNFTKITKDTDIKKLDGATITFKKDETCDIKN